MTTLVICMQAVFNHFIEVFVMFSIFWYCDAFAVFVLLFKYNVNRLFNFRFCCDNLPHMMPLLGHVITKAQRFIERSMPCIFYLAINCGNVQ